MRPRSAPHPFATLTIIRRVGVMEPLRSRRRCCRADTGRPRQLGRFDAVIRHEGFQPGCSLRILRSDPLMSSRPDNPVSNRNRGEWCSARITGDGRREDRPDQTATAAIPARRGGAGRHPREHAEEDRRRGQQSDAHRARENRRRPRREDSRSRLQVKLRGRERGNSEGTLA